MNMNFLMDEHKGLARSVGPFSVPTAGLGSCFSCRRNGRGVGFTSHGGIYSDNRKYSSLTQFSYTALPHLTRLQRGIL